MSVMTNRVDRSPPGSAAAGSESSTSPTRSDCATGGGELAVVQTLPFELVEGPVALTGHTAVCS
jgi:hypothetical protein